MKTDCRRCAWFRYFLAVVVFLAFTAACQAQSCALCYTQAASASAKLIQGLRSGIIVLVIPPMFMSVGITILAYRKRNQCVGPGGRDESRSDW